MDWSLEWSPTPNLSWNWHIYSFHVSAEAAEAARLDVLKSSGMDHDESHWRILGPVVSGSKCPASYNA